MKDLELKGIIRTAVEGMNLSLHWNGESHILAAECIRTFPTVTYPATLLLKREETETNKPSGVQKKETSVIAALYHGRGDKHRMYREAPFDLLYGFRGHQDAVDLLSPYEMLLHYSMERIHAPNNDEARSRATWTEEGEMYEQWRKAQGVEPEYKPGEHYIATEGENRILMPSLRHLYGLRHCWCWEARERPHPPTWSFAKVPRVQFSPEEMRGC